jgi:hypothetical protein
MAGRMVIRRGWEQRRTDRTSRRYRTKGCTGRRCQSLIGAGGEARTGCGRDSLVPVRRSQIACGMRMLRHDASVAQVELRGRRRREQGLASNSWITIYMMAFVELDFFFFDNAPLNQGRHRQPQIMYYPVCIRLALSSSWTLMEGRHWTVMPQATCSDGRLGEVLGWEYYKWAGAVKCLTIHARAK